MRDDGRDGEVADDNWLKRVTDTVEGEQEEEWDWQQELEEWDEGLQELEQTEAGRIRMGGGVGEQSDIGDDLLRRMQWEKKQRQQRR